MTRASGARLGGAVLGLVLAAGWIGAHRLARERSGARRLVQSAAPVSIAAYDSATVVVRGRLTGTARARLAATVGLGGALLVVLDSADVRVCEDLGRQLRILRRRAGPTLPLVVVTTPGALPTMRVFARREQLRLAALIEVGATELLVGTARVPTPAALVVRKEDLNVVGVAHPRRFRNIRIRSSADELSAALPPGAGGQFTP